jgi:hypothetical protein
MLPFNTIAQQLQTAAEKPRGSRVVAAAEQSAAEQGAQRCIGRQQQGSLFRIERLQRTSTAEPTLCDEKVCTKARGVR